MRCKVYIGIPMTGYDKQEMIKLSKRACYIAESYGLEAWAPVLNENISGNGKLENNDNELDWKWPLDKNALNDCFVFVNLRADEKSFGCEDEYGRHRYSEWQPSFKISPKHAAGYISIANYQTDGLFGDMDVCFKYISENFGQHHQRVLFKLKIWFKSGPYWVYRQLRRLFQ